MFKAGDIVLIRPGVVIKRYKDKTLVRYMTAQQAEVICSSETLTSLILSTTGEAIESRTDRLMHIVPEIVDDLKEVVSDAYYQRLQNKRKRWSAEESESIRKALSAMVLSFSASMNRSVPSIEWEMYRALKESGCKG